MATGACIPHISRGLHAAHDSHIFCACSGRRARVSALHLRRGWLWHVAAEPHGLVVAWLVWYRVCGLCSVSVPVLFCPGAFLWLGVGGPGKQQEGSKSNQV